MSATTKGLGVAQELNALHVEPMGDECYQQGQTCAIKPQKVETLVAQEPLALHHRLKVLLGSFCQAT